MIQLHRTIATNGIRDKVDIRWMTSSTNNNDICDWLDYKGIIRRSEGKKHSNVCWSNV